MEIIELDSSKIITLSKLSIKLDGLEVSSLKTIIENKIRFIYAKYKIKPLSLEFSIVDNGYVLKVSHSYIGNILFKGFIIKIPPKFAYLDSEKMLKLASITSNRDSILSSGEVFRDYCGSEEAVDSLEFFYQAFLDKFNICIKNGLQHNYIEKSHTSRNLRGRLDLSKYSKMPQPLFDIYQIIRERTPDTYLNRVLKSIILHIIKTSRNSEVIIKASLIRKNLMDISDIELLDSVDNQDLEDKTFKRKDYKDVVELAATIINGFDPQYKSTIGFLPEYIINLDYLFERLCYQYLDEIFVKPEFEVTYQRAVEHIFSIKGISGKAELDISVSSNNTSFITNEIVVDAKNKFSGTENGLKASISDLYQIFYYLNITQAEYAILLYPGHSSDYTKFPIEGSQGNTAYRKQVDSTLKNLRDNDQIVDFKGKRLVFWRLRLDGSLKDTRDSFVQLANFILESMKQPL